MSKQPVPPGPRGRTLLGSLRDLQHRPLEFFTETAGEYGDLARIRVGPKKFLLATSPTLAEQILLHSKGDSGMLFDRTWLGPSEIFGNGLLASQGAYWRKERKLIQPAFHRSRLAGYGEIISARTLDALKSWQPGETRDIHLDLIQLTLRIVGELLFGDDLSQEQVRMIGDVLTTALLQSTKRVRVLQFVADLPTKRKRDFRRGVSEVNKLVYGIIACRRKQSPREDILGMLMEAEDEQGKLSDLEVRDEAMTIFGAGFETTASMIAWACYLVSQHSEVKERLDAELNEVLGDREPCLEDVPSLSYASSILKESLRLYPPGWVIARTAQRATTLGGYEIEQGTTVRMSPWVMHRDARWFANPLEFRPERWANDLESRLPRCAFLPFGAGPRRCIGESVAMMIGLIVFASIQNRFTMAPVDSSHIEPIALLTLRPRNGMRMLIT
jgi:cytochrome P450